MEQMLQYRQQRAEQAQDRRRTEKQRKQQQHRDKLLPGRKAGGKLLGSDLQQNRVKEITEWKTKAGYNDYQSMENMVQAEIARDIQDESHSIKQEHPKYESGRSGAEGRDGEIDGLTPKRVNKQVLQTAQKMILEIELALRSMQDLRFLEKSTLIADWKKAQVKNEQRADDEIFGDGCADELLGISKEIERMSAFIEECSAEIIRMQAFQSTVLKERLKGCKKWTKALAAHLAKRTDRHGTMEENLKGLRLKVEVQTHILKQTEEEMREEQEELFFSQQEEWETMTEKIQRMWEERGATERDIAHDKFTRTEDQHKITAKENRYAVLLGGNGGEAKSESDRKELEANNTASAVTQAGRSRESPAGGSGDHEGGTRRSSEHSKANSVEVGSLRTEADQTKDLKQDGWSLQNNELARWKIHARHERCIAKTTQSQQQQKAQMRKLKEYKWLHRQCRQQSSRKSLNPQIGAKWRMRNPGKTRRTYGELRFTKKSALRSEQWAMQRKRVQGCARFTVETTRSGDWQKYTSRGRQTYQAVLALAVLILAVLTHDLNNNAETLTVHSTMAEAWLNGTVGKDTDAAVRRTVVNGSNDQTTNTAAVEAVDSATLNLTARGTINAGIPSKTYMTVVGVVDIEPGEILRAVIDAAIAVATGIGEAFRMVVSAVIEGIIRLTNEAKGKGSTMEMKNRTDSAAVCGATKVARNGATTAAIEAVLRTAFSMEVDTKTDTEVEGASMAAVGKIIGDTDTDKQEQFSGVNTNKRIYHVRAGQGERSHDGQGEQQGGSGQSGSGNAARAGTQHKLGWEVDMNHEDEVWHHKEEYRPDQERHRKTAD
jgi:hypothetical protein